MVSAVHTTEDLQVTAAALQGELQRLELQRQALERELAAVVAHLGSVRRTLGVIGHLKGAALPAPPDGGRVEEGRLPATAVEAVAAIEAGAVSAAGAAGEAGASEQTEAATDDATAADRNGAAVAAGNYGRLTEQILEYLATTGGAEVRAREVAAALGRDESAGSINAVRSTLDRLVGASRVRRAGRGLYGAAV
ncbi:hypothetical protein [Streptomyces sp. NPDC026673]|uniref:hypothetical protein n=1 Tax=Streptomyces sp. NPDC026673 TaxID=3155724 RepID=UPI00340D40F2